MSTCLAGSHARRREGPSCVALAGDRQGPERRSEASTAAGRVRTAPGGRIGPPGPSRRLPRVIGHRVGREVRASTTPCRERTQAPVETVDKTGDSGRDSSASSTAAVDYWGARDAWGAQRGGRSCQGAAARGRLPLATRAACRLGHLTPGFRTCILRCPLCMQCQDRLIDGDACGSGPRTYRDK